MVLVEIHHDVLYQNHCSWAFKTSEFDIGFSVVQHSSGEEGKIVVGIKRADAHVCTQRGAIICSSPGKCKNFFMGCSYGELSYDSGL